MDKAQVGKFLAAHGLWKTRLRQAVDTGKAEWDVLTVRRDDQCDFGKWLKSLPPQQRMSEQCKNVSGLHATFHQEAARVLELVVAGRKKDAGELLETGGRFATASSQLSMEMMRWKDAS